MLEDKSNVIEELSFVVCEQVRVLCSTLFVGKPTPTELAKSIISAKNLDYTLSYLRGNLPIVDTSETITYLEDFLNSEDFISAWNTQYLLFESVFDGSLPPLNDLAFGDWTRLMSVDPILRELEGIRYSDLCRIKKEADEQLSNTLRRLGVSADKGMEDYFFSRLVSRTENTDVRHKMGKLWLLQKNQSIPIFEQKLCDLVKIRKEISNSIGVSSPAKTIVEDGFLGYDQLIQFMDNCFEELNHLNQWLHSQINPLYPDKVNLLVDYPYHVNTTNKPKSGLRVPFDYCMSFIKDICLRYLNLDIEVSTSPNFHLVVKKENKILGFVKFDIIGRAIKIKEGNEEGMIGRILVKSYDEDTGTVNVTDVQSIFHELGHAIAHILSFSKAYSNYKFDKLSYEKMELLSTWFEKWVFTTEFEKAMKMNSLQKLVYKQKNKIRAMESIRFFQANTMSAYVDLILHSDSSKTPSSILNSVMRKFPNLRNIPTADLLSTFCHFTFRSHPGGGFIYPIAECFSAQQHMFIINANAGERKEFIVPDGLQAAFSSEKALELPNPSAPRKFLAHLLNTKI